MFAVIAGPATYPVEAKSIDQAISRAKKIMRSEGLNACNVVEIVAGTIKQSQEVRK